MSRTLYLHSETVPHFVAVGKPVEMHKVTLEVYFTRSGSLWSRAYLNGKLAWDCGPYRPSPLIREDNERLRYIDDCRAFFCAWVDGANGREGEERTSRRESFTPYGLVNLPLLASLSESIGPFCDD